MIAAPEIAALRLPADLASLAPARAALAERLDRRGWDGDDAAPVMLAVSEALSNAIEHGSAPGARVELAIEVDEDRVTLRVADEGRPGAAGWREPAPPDPSSVRGRGLLIMRAVADEMAVRAGVRGTEVRLVFARAGAALLVSS